MPIRNIGPASKLGAALLSILALGTASGCAHHILIGHARESSLDRQAVKAMKGKWVVVLPSENQVDRGALARELLAEQARKRGGFEVVSDESVLRAMSEHGMEPGRPCSDQQALALARAVSADGVLVSKYGEDAMSVRLLAAGSGEPIFETRATVQMSAREFTDAAMLDVLSRAAGKSLAGKKNIRVVRKVRKDGRESAGAVVVGVMGAILGLVLAGMALGG